MPHAQDRGLRSAPSWPDDWDRVAGKRALAPRVAPPLHLRLQRRRRQLDTPCRRHRAMRHRKRPQSKAFGCLGEHAPSDPMAQPPKSKAFPRRSHETMSIKPHTSRGAFLGDARRCSALRCLTRASPLSLGVRALSRSAGPHARLTERHSPPFGCRFDPVFFFYRSALASVSLAQRELAVWA